MFPRAPRLIASDVKNVTGFKNKKNKLTLRCYQIDSSLIQPAARVVPKAQKKGKTRLNMILLVITGLFLLGAGYSEERFYARKENMINSQIKARGVTDERVLKAMHKVERHLFVPLMYRYLSYGDHPLPIGEGQTISQPYIVALMTELLELKGGEKVLEIGTGSGYQAAILAELAKWVYTIEILKPLAERSKELLKELGYENIKVKHGDGFLGWPEYAPFDAIIVTCAPEEIPAP